MGIIACKFGGTSTANADMFRRINGILMADCDRRYVVLSAPGRDGQREKVTDMLYKGDIAGTARRFESMARDLNVEMDFDAVLRRTTHESEAALASRGEYLCARLFAEWSGIPFVDAAKLIWFDARGRLDACRTRASLRRMASLIPRAVIPGFYGSDLSGRIVTFPRNGSDITGALVAAGTGASLYENWTDVPGLMTGDPDTDPDARVIPEITYAKMREISQGGAQVLHPDCLDAVARAGIPTRIRCTMNPDLPGTLVQ